MMLDKKRSALAVGVPAALLIGLSLLPWTSGTTGDVLRHGPVTVTGGQAAPGAVGLAVICVVALLALMTGGRVIRAASSAVVLLAAVGALVVISLVVLRPHEVVAAALSQELARTTAPDAAGTTTVWGWLALLVAVVLLVGSFAVARAAQQWSGLSSRYDRDRPARGPRGEVRTAWDELSDGQDPTLRDEPGPT